MIRSFLAILLGAAVMLGAIGIAPVRANDDVAKVIAGIAGLYILNKALEGRKDGASRRDGRHHRKQVYRHGRHHDGAHRIQRKRHDRGYGIHHRRHVQKSAPRRCLREHWTRRGTQHVYGARCMQHRARYALPRNCLRRARGHGGPAYFYSPRCLRQHGWRA